jgi:peroxiredoxin family protein
MIYPLTANQHWQPVNANSAATIGILLISGGHERAHYAFVLASGAAAIGRRVVVFATNDGCRALLRGDEYTAEDRAMQARGVATLAELREACAELGVTLVACEAGLRTAGLDAAALLEGVTVAGVVSFLAETGDGPVITL